MLDDFFGQSLDDVLHDLTGADDQLVVRALIDSLIESEPSWPGDGDAPFYQEDASYERTDDAFHGHGLMWAEFRRSIAYEQRFFNDTAKELLTDIFEGIHRQRDAGRRQPVVVIEPGSLEARLIRARIADDLVDRKEIAENPRRHMGPPPTRKRRAGRMNPSGICAFYAAYDLLTCVAELRPRVGSIVLSAEFEIIRPIVALDMTRFDAEPKELNLFAKDHVKRMAQWRFMQTFMHEIAQPVSPNDEHLDYIPTQAVGEYLLRHHQFHLDGQERSIEAIIFRSAQHPTGKNIVILGDACTVETPRAERVASSGLGAAFDALRNESSSWGFGPEPCLRYRPESLKLHRIKEAEFTPEPFYDYGSNDEF